MPEVDPLHDALAAVDALIAALRAASYAGREGVKAEMLTLARGPEGARVREHLEAKKREELLELQWEIEEVLEATAPPKPVVVPEKVEPPPPPPEPEDPNRPLTAKDLVLIYDDPRGLMLHKSKVGDRWFATQVDPRTGTPQTFELHPQEIAGIKQQLAGSPYWLLGAGGVAAAPAPGAVPRTAPRPPGKPGPRG